MAKIDYTGRVAIVTGAGGGLGKTYALELGKRGAKVVVNDFGGARDGTGGGNTMADQVVETIQTTAKTDKIGDGKIFVLDVNQAVRVRTGESNEDAL